jgi:hypothetical protein
MIGEAFGILVVVALLAVGIVKAKNRWGGATINGGKKPITLKPGVVVISGRVHPLTGAQAQAISGGKSERLVVGTLPVPVLVVTGRRGARPSSSAASGLPRWRPAGSTRQPRRPDGKRTAGSGCSSAPGRLHNYASACVRASGRVEDALRPVRRQSPADRMAVSAVPGVFPSGALCCRQTPQSAFDALDLDGCHPLIVAD